MAPGFPRRRSADSDDTSRPVVITAARESYQDELAARKKRYFILMSIRIPALLLAAGALAIWNNPWIAFAIVVGSIPIPWIAVIGANDRPPLPKHLQNRYVAGSISAMPMNYALPPGMTGTARPDPTEPDPTEPDPTEHDPTEHDPDESDAAP